MRIQTLQWICGLLAALCCIVLGGWTILINFDAYKSLDEGASNYSRLSAAIVAANAISSERGPSNSAMAATAETEATLVAALAEKRAATDQTLDDLLGLFSKETVTNPRIQTEFDNLKEALGLGRAAVDGVVALPPDERTGTTIANAILLMFGAADKAINWRNALAQMSVELTPQIGVEIIVASAASDLREYEGRLGSYVVMMLTSGPADDVRHFQRYQQTLERLATLHNLLKVYAAPYFGQADIQDLLTEVDEGYFGKALGYVRSITAMHAPQNSMSAGDFTSVYVPMMASSEALRGAVSVASERRLLELRDLALRSVIVAAGLTVLALLVLTAVSLLFRSRLFAPLFELSHQVTTIAEGDLTEPRTPVRSSREVQHMFASVAKLRAQQIQKQQLEINQQNLTNKLKMLAETDVLTGLPNRRAITDRARELLRIADATGEPLGIIMLDIDHFKKVNDSFGHDIGDLVLQTVANTLPRKLRSTDVFGRYGGEEFMAIIPSAGEENLRAIADLLRVTLEDTTISPEQDLTVTGSFGVAVRRPNSDMTWEVLVAAADRNLYRAKRAGRNRVSGPNTRASAPPTA